VRAGQSEVVASFPDLRQTKADSDRNAGVAMVSVGRSLRELGSRRHLFSVGVWLKRRGSYGLSRPIAERVRLAASSVFRGGVARRDPHGRDQRA